MTAKETGRGPAVSVMYNLINDSTIRNSKTENSINDDHQIINALLLYSYLLVRILLRDNLQWSLTEWEPTVQHVGDKAGSFECLP